MLSTELQAFLDSLTDWDRGIVMKTLSKEVRDSRVLFPQEPEAIPQTEQHREQQYLLPAFANKFDDVFNKMHESNEKLDVIGGMTIGVAEALDAVLDDVQTLKITSEIINTQAIPVAYEECEAYTEIVTYEKCEAYEEPETYEAFEAYEEPEPPTVNDTPKAVAKPKTPKKAGGKKNV